MDVTVWVKSSYSFSNGNCVEIGELPNGMIGLRDSKNPDGPVLRFSRGEIRSFFDGVLLGEFQRFT